MNGRAGIGYRARYLEALLAGEGPAVLEIMPDHWFGDPAAETTLARLAEQYAVVFHDVGMSLGTAGDASLGKARLREIARLARAARPIAFGEHLALTRSPAGVDLGHLAPLWLTHELLGLVADRVRAIQDVLGVPVVVENIAARSRFPGRTSASRTSSERWSRGPAAVSCSTSRTCSTPRATSDSTRRSGSPSTRSRRSSNSISPAGSRTVVPGSTATASPSRTIRWRCSRA